MKQNIWYLNTSGVKRCFEMKQSRFVGKRSESFFLKRVKIVEEHS